MGDPTWIDVAQVTAAVFAVIAAVAIPLTAYLRRPALVLTEREARRHSQVEADAPYLRLLVENKARRRVARGTRVILLGYRAQGASTDEWTSLAHPALGWPSATGEREVTEGEVTVYAGNSRPVGLGIFRNAMRMADGKLRRGPGHSGISQFAPGDPRGSWHLCLTMHANLDILNDRDKLGPGEWIIHLLLGAEDGDAQRYDVHVAWSADAPDGRTVLAEALDRLHVEKA